ncbi:hypothetical protein F5884DRAFT_485711 [Xylogone sp. PMI_703]|nr:hypothetical protein F5884DRAFT_485711 [Xylogone sp. PMI_703]
MTHVRSDQAVVQLHSNSAAKEPKSSGSTLGPVATTSIEPRPSSTLWTSNPRHWNIRSAMSEFIYITGRTQSPLSPSPRPPQSIRPPSSTPTKVSQIASKLVSKASSTSSLNAMATVSPSPRIPVSRKSTPYDNDDENMSTLPDPRSRNVTPSTENVSPAPQQHPDLSNEVAALSNKLINAINHQTNLDDTLSATRHELEVAHERIKQLEQRDKEHTDLVSRGILIRKSLADLEKNKLVLTLAEERKQRAEIEKAKKSMEKELENLTTALFEEANKMVVAAREEAQKEHDAVQKKNEQLKAQLADTESLLISHQEQLAELKQVLEHMAEEKDDLTNNTAPSTPAVTKFESKDDEKNETETTQSSSEPEPVQPSYPTSFTQLIQPVLRTDLAAYDDFMSLLRMSKNVYGHRASSGSYGSIGLGFANLTGVHGHQPNGSTTSLATAVTLGSSPATPTTPASAVSASSAPGPLTPLKETKFYKRALAEDIEPTLRLDTAPGLSWLARRTVLTAMCEGTLVVDPMPSNTKLYIFPCALCGESRKDPAHIRTHRFRTSENENSQRYPLCRYCLGRVRSSCDFLGFLRVLKDGHWRVEDEEGEKMAWEESVRLREQMFWCRMGGGVIPAAQHQSDEKKEQEKKASAKETSVPAVEVIDATKPPTKRMSKNLSRDDTAEGLWQAAQDDAAPPQNPSSTAAAEPAPSPSVAPEPANTSAPVEEIVIKEPEPEPESEPVSSIDPASVPLPAEDEIDELEESAESAEKVELVPEPKSEEPDKKRASIQSISSVQTKLSHHEEKPDGVKRLSLTIPGSFVDAQS